jgi:phosphoglycolate phosphatase-like HAD superfamily hydrolase
VTVTADRLAEMNATLEAIAYCYHRALVEIVEDCGHDKPDIAKIAAYAQNALAYAEEKLSEEDVDTIRKALNWQQEWQQAVERFRDQRHAALAAVAPTEAQP